MSAYLVEDDVIQAIVTWLGTTKQHMAADHIKLMGLENATPDERCQALLDLNQKSVDARYRTSEATPSIKFKKVSLSPIAVYKQIDGYLYQSCEGDCDEQPLFKGLEAMKNQLACEIVDSTEEYKKASWV